WVQGTAIDWQQLWTARPGTTHLPTYPFARERCWFPRRRFGSGDASRLGEGGSPLEDVQVGVAAVEQGSAKQWLCFGDGWSEPTSDRPPVDWSAYERGDGAGQVVVVSDEEGDRVAIEDELRQIAARQAPAAIRVPVVRRLNPEEQSTAATRS